jgi:hypothetical protein
MKTYTWALMQNFRGKNIILEKVGAVFVKFYGLKHN